MLIELSESRPCAVTQRPPGRPQM